VVSGRGGQRFEQAPDIAGGARRGTPVSSFIRVDDRPIRLRCDIERADAILCFDATLLDARLLAAARPDTLIVVNSAQPPGHFEQALPGHRVVPVDGLSISRRHGLGRIVNSALLGAFACALGHPPLDALQRTIRELSPRLTDENVAACAAGYEAVQALAGNEAANAPEKDDAA